jgi:hypothetical protein
VLYPLIFLELGRGQRRAGQKARMVEVLAAEHYASDGKIQAAQPKKRKRRGPAKKKSKTNHTGDDDNAEDIDFVSGSDSEISTDSSNSEVEHIPTNAEVLLSSSKPYLPFLDSRFFLIENSPYNRMRFRKAEAENDN